jgi:hypothetical protein
VGSLHGRQIAHGKSPPVLAKSCFVGQIVIGLNYLKKLMSVVL